MTFSVFDFSDIKRRAMFPANRPQDAGTPVMPAPVIDYGMYAGFPAPPLHPFAGIDGVVFDENGHCVSFGPDTAPCEYLAADFDPA